ncbi:hypothetical protein H1D32_06920 [Anaerobacillus sp. CMMVII]|uniref:hypothetical protein n=1 Tax=Anaerobacillus sp. CMMVII TaxID=2755588 RepID=UPI0021B7C551|nr:hypothetical protein [Anaerobacillus sp. CMMVII]MCT8137497.1 hypothetical protein [Anaerobacillus sp. CMMVII]
MKISINLLPNIEKEKSSNLLLLPIAGLILIIAASAVLLYSYINLSKEVDRLEQTIASSIETKNELQQAFSIKTTGITEHNIIDQYQNVNDFINSIYNDTVGLKTNVYQLLPDNANVESYVFTIDGDLLVTVTFHSKGDTAIYLHRLLQADFVTSALVTSIKSDIEDASYTSLFEVKLKTMEGEE